METVDNDRHSLRRRSPAAAKEGPLMPHQSDRVDDDLDMVRQLLARDEVVWRQFVSQYQRLLIHRIRSVATELHLPAPTDDTIDEICADLFSALLSGNMDSLRQFSGRSRLSTWLTVVVRRTALRYFAKASRRPVQPDTAELDCIPVPDDSIVKDRQKEQIRTDLALQHLSSDDRRLMRMFYNEQLSYEQIAERFGISVNTVGPKLDRARRRLRTILNRRHSNGEACDD